MSGERADRDADDEGEAMGIDELARRCGTTVRTIREYQTLRVMPSPRRVGRVARYGEVHLDRWQAIVRLQERGYSLAAIADLFQAWETGTSLPAVLGVTDSQLLGALDEQPVIVGEAELAAALPEVLASPALQRRAEAAGLVHRTRDERYVVRSPALVQLVADAIAAGVPAGEAVGIVEAVDAHTREIAGAAVTALLAHVLDGDGATPIDLLRRGRPLLAQAVASVLIHHVGATLAAVAGDREDVVELVDEIRIGVIRDAG